MDNGIPGGPPAPYEVARNRLMSRISEVEFIAETLTDEDAYTELLDILQSTIDETYHSESVTIQHYTQWSDRLARALGDRTELDKEYAAELTSVLKEIKREASELNTPPTG